MHPVFSSGWYQQQRERWDFVRLLPALLLLFAALAKAYSAPELAAGGGLLSNEYLLLTVIFVEACLSVLIAFSCTAFSWTIALITFSVLFCAASITEIRGANCNCFGTRLPTWLSIVVDVAVLAVCVMFRPTERHRERISRKTLVGSGVIAISLLALGGWRLDAASRGESLEFLLAEESVSQRWPLDATVAEQLNVF